MQLQEDASDQDGEQKHSFDAGVQKAIAPLRTQGQLAAGSDHSADGGKASSASTDDMEMGVVERGVKQEQSAVVERSTQLPETGTAAAAPPCASRPSHAVAAAVAPAAAPSPEPEEEEEVEEEEEEPLRVTIDSRERLRWSPQLHQRFCKAVADLGGSPFAKPKDIVIKMGVPGLTLAHVKSHLQKYRQQEGVTFVPHSTRNPPGMSRRFQQYPAPPQQWHAPADLEGPPGAKRARISATVPDSNDERFWAQQQHQAAQQVQRSGGGSVATVPGSANEPGQLQRYLQALSSAAAATHEPEAAPAPPRTQPQPASGGEDEGGVGADALHKLHALAELASAQLDEVTAAQQPVEEQAAAMAPLAERLAVQAQLGAPDAGLGAQLESLLVQHAQLQSAARQHLQQGVRLAEDLQAFQRAAQELLAQSQAPPQLQPQQSASPSAVPAAPAAATTAVPAATGEQAGAAVGGCAVPAPVPAASLPQQPAAVPPHLASQLLAMMAAAANMGAARPPGFMVPTPQTLAAPITAAASLAQLQQLYQSAALMAARQQG